MKNTLRAGKIAIATLALLAIAANAENTNTNRRTTACHTPHGTTISDYYIGKNLGRNVKCDTSSVFSQAAQNRFVEFKPVGFFADSNFTEHTTLTVPEDYTKDYHVYVKYEATLYYEVNGMTHVANGFPYHLHTFFNQNTLNAFLNYQIGGTPTKESDSLYTYTFSTWDLHKDGIWRPTFNSSNKTIKALLMHPIRIDYMSDYFEYTVNSQEELPDLSELEKIFGNDWKFAGWSASQNAFDATFMNVPNNTGYTAFYPHFRKEKNITILFNGIQKTLETIIIDRNETDKSINDRVNKIIQKFIKPANKDMGNEIYAFENWEENDDGYYVPKYKIFPKQYTIEFVVNGKNVQTLKGNYGTTAHLPKPEPIEGYTFTGWKVTDAAGRILPVTKATVIFGITYSNLKVEALFVPTAYEINLHNKFATKIQSVSYTIESDDIILPLLKNTKSHIFEGWFDNENFAGEAVTKIPHGSIGDVKLFAKWTPKPIEVKIRGRIEDTIIYDGKEHIAQTFEITTNDTSYTAKDFKFNGKNYISAIEAGEYSMGLKASDFENTNPDFKNVKFEVTDGKLTIAKRKITISSASAQKAYDGKPLTSLKINIEGGFTKDEGIEIEWDESAAQTEVGTAKNSFHIAAKKGTNLENYDIELDYGELTVTEQEKKEEEKIVSTDFEKKEEKADTTDSEKKGIVGTEKKDKDKENKPETKKTIKGFGATNGDNDDGKTVIETLAAPKFSISTNGRSIEVNNAVIGSKLAIYDMQGRLVRMAKISHGTEHVDLENSGSYIIKTFNRVVRVNLD